MEVRSSERMRKEHITTFTQVFKDSHMEGKVMTSLPVGAGLSLRCAQQSDDWLTVLSLSLSTPK